MYKVTPTLNPNSNFMHVNNCIHLFFRHFNGVSHSVNTAVREKESRFNYLRVGIINQRPNGMEIIAQASRRIYYFYIQTSSLQYIFLLIHKAATINFIFDNIPRKPLHNLSAFLFKAAVVRAQMYSSVWSILEGALLQRANNAQGSQKRCGRVSLHLALMYSPLCYIFPRSRFINISDTVAGFE